MRWLIGTEDKRESVESVLSECLDENHNMSENIWKP